MAERLPITPEVAIPLAELEFRASRASGPGGQGVNTTDSRVELRFDLAGSYSSASSPTSLRSPSSRSNSRRASWSRPTRA